jgi:outer membrane biosynthesis protein TonB
MLLAFTASRAAPQQPPPSPAGRETHLPEPPVVPTSNPVAIPPDWLCRIFACPSQSAPARARVPGGNQSPWSCPTRSWDASLALAAAARISGEVVLVATIVRDGGIAELRVISGHPFLVPAALKYWKSCRHTPLPEPDEMAQLVETIRVPFRFTQGNPVPLVPIPSVSR